MTEQNNEGLSLVDEVDRINENKKIRSAVLAIGKELGDDELLVEEVLIPVNFDPEHRRRGHLVLIYADDFVGSSDDDDPNLYWIRERTQKILQSLEIPFQIVELPDQE